ncbi:hypothetical protein GOP47_0018926 [Adiantum capillus-veneris]|uniref:Zinc finger PHD-type domain-containing protein n=1 Tax=Adiantum capillus-veneris TaxID=13818 RepID=A0A9D4UEM3_ADICA|nr:hypothetical protein GOP47_0018926 [Adiantum capillus-veneris]
MLATHNALHGSSSPAIATLHLESTLTRIQRQVSEMAEEEDVTMAPAEREGEESSDDDIEIVPKSVDGYWLEYGDETPVSFTTLPYFKTDDEALSEKVVYVRGTQDNGMRLYVRAIAWKLELTKDAKPVFHLKTEKYWIQLMKPRKSYEDTIRSIISVAYFLNHALVNPDDSEKVVWGHIKELFPSWEVAPNRNDLASHLPTVQFFAASDECLAASTALQSIDTGILKKRLASTTEASRGSGRKGVHVSDDEDEGQGEPEQKRGKFEVDDLNAGEDMDGYGEEAEDDVGDLAETVCCICDNGGSVICCDGPCLRSFHLNKGAGGADDSHCSTLGFSKAEAERMDKFFCPNCKFKEHQCYACGRLGCSDDKAGAAQEVYLCDAAMCGHFYHPDCVAEMILKDKDTSDKAALAESIKEGKGFTCPMHKCCKCGKGEVKQERDLQFGVCRRCPRVWHRKCLPFPLPDDGSDDEEEENDEPQRAWDDLLPNRILVYCKRHPIITRLGTPARNHVKFPEGSLPTPKKVPMKSKTEQQEKKLKLIKVRNSTDSLKGAVGEKAARLSELDGLRKKKLARKDDSAPRVSSIKSSADGTFLIKGRTTVEKRDLSSRDDAQKMSKLPSLSKGVVKLERSSSLVSKPPTPRESALRQLQQKSKSSGLKAIIIDNETKNMVSELIEKAKTLVTMDSVLQKHDIPTIYRRSSKTPDKKYSLFKIESITKGMRKAVETLENGGSIEDAKATCSPDFIKFIELCKKDLHVYLSPFLYGARYTSYGRHFTKSEKLEEIVDRLHWYIDKGDMVVDFCCGANEFSLFTRKKLEETGKKCEYRNFDLIQTKNEFNFTKRDWFQVRPDELPDGSKLVMGLNPPFGVKGNLATQFIDHALKFKPKLIILIVPKETERLDHKRDPYDLVWEDPDLLSGQSFYLPGSVDVDENPLNDWNVVAPPLYIWSRPDWTTKHKDIALGKGHISPDSHTRFVGPLWRPPSRPTSPSSLLDFNMGKNESFSAPMEVEEEEENNKDYATLVQTRKEEKQIGVQDSKRKLDRSSSAKLKDESKRNKEPLESKSKVSPSKVINTAAKDEGLNSKVKTISKSAIKDGSVSKKEPEERGSDPLKKKPSEGSEVKQESIKSEKKRDLFKGRSSEGQSHAIPATEKGRSSEGESLAIPATEKVEKAKPHPHQSPEKSRRNSELRLDASRKDRKSNDRSDRGEDNRTDPAWDGHQWKRPSEKHRSNTEGDLSGRRSPNRHDKYESGRRKSPDRFDRHSSGRHGENRKASPERSRHMVNEPRRRSPERSRHVATEQRRGSPEKSGPSSVVDLSTFFSNNDVERDRSRDYDDLPRKSSGKDYQDSSSYRGGSPSRKYVSEEDKRPWVDINNYQAGTESRVRTNEHLNAGYMNSGLAKTSYHDMAPYGVSSSEAQMGTLGRHYYDSGAPGARRPDAYDGQISRLYNDVPLTRQREFYQPDLPREMVSLDRYGGQILTESSFRGSGGGGVGALAEMNIPPPWPAARAPPNVYPSPYVSQVQHQASLGIGDSSRLPTHGIFDNRLAQTPNVRSHYPPSQGRYPGQTNQQFTGGWYDD